MTKEDEYEVGPMLRIFRCMRKKEQVTETCASVSDTLGKLSQLGIKRRIMISRDHEGIKNLVAAECRINKMRGDLLSEDKAEAIKTLRRGTKMVMVGDGVTNASIMADIMADADVDGLAYFSWRLIRVDTRDPSSARMNSSASGLAPHSRCLMRCACSPIATSGRI